MPCSVFVLQTRLITEGCQVHRAETQQIQVTQTNHAGPPPEGVQSEGLSMLVRTVIA